MMAALPPVTMDARQIKTRRALLAALLLLLETRPFDQVTIREISKAAGIGYATYFRHYPSKEALLDDLAAAEIAGLLARALPVLFSDNSRQSCILLFEHLVEHRALWTALLTGGAAATVKQEFIEQSKSAAAEHGAVGGWLPDELRIVFAVNATIEIMAWWLEQADFPIDHIAEILDRLVVAPSMQP